MELRKGGFHLGVAETPAVRRVSNWCLGLSTGLRSLSRSCLCLFFRFPCPFSTSYSAGHRIALNIIVKVLPRVGITIRTIYVIVS